MRYVEENKDLSEDQGTYGDSQSSGSTARFRRHQTPRSQHEAGNRIKQKKSYTAPDFVRDSSKKRRLALHRRKSSVSSCCAAQVRTECKKRASKRERGLAVPAVLASPLFHHARCVLRFALLVPLSMEPCRFDMACWRPLCPFSHSGPSRAARWAAVWSFLADQEEHIVDVPGPQIAAGHERKP